MADMEMTEIDETKSSSSGSDEDSSQDENAAAPPPAAGGVDDSSSGDDSDSDSEGAESASDPELRNIMNEIENSASDPDDVPAKADKRGRKIKFLLREYAQGATTHGVPHLGDAHTKKVIMFWSLMLLVCAATFGYLFSTTMITYFKYETNIDVAMEQKSRYFPAVTICNLSPYKKGPLLEIDQLAALIYAFEYATDQQKKELLAEWDEPVV